MELESEHLYHKIEITIINKEEEVNSEVEIEDHLTEDQDRIEDIDKIKKIIMIEENSNDEEGQQFMLNG